MGRDERRYRLRRGHRAARRPGDQQLRALPRRGHTVRVAARALAPVLGPLRDERSAAALLKSRQGALDILVRRGARLERTCRSRADYKP